MSPLAHSEVSEKDNLHEVRLQRRNRGKRFWFALITVLSLNVIATIIILFNSPSFGRPEWVNNVLYIQARVWGGTWVVALILLLLDRKIAFGMLLGAGASSVLVLFSAFCLL